jgi:hypothetical protein
MMRSPNSTLQWCRWAREQAHAQRLNDREAHLLVLLATMADQTGEGRAARGDLARFMTVSERSVSRYLAQLTSKGLVACPRRRGERLRWRLNPGRHPLDQGVLGASERDTQVSRSDARAARLRDIQMSLSPDNGKGHLGVSLVGHPGVPQKDQDVLLPPQNAGEREHASALAPKLERVVAILQEAPGLLVVDAAVNSILLGHPEPGYDHLRAAHVVLARGLEGRYERGASGNGVLKAELDRQGREAAREAARRRPSRATDPASAGQQRLRPDYDRAAGLR